MQFSRLTKVVLGLAAGYAMFACDSTSPGFGTLRVNLTDAPFPFDSVSLVDAWIVRVDARVTAADSASTADDTDEGDAKSAGWTTIAEPDQKFELLALRNGITAFLGDNELPARTYNGFRLILDPSKSSITLKDGTVLDGANGGIIFPSGAQTGIKIVLNQPVQIVANDTTEMLVDFDVNDSFVMRGNSIKNNGLLFKPVVKATITQQ